jgi:hypothetical protein
MTIDPTIIWGWLITLPRAAEAGAAARGRG